MRRGKWRNSPLTVPFLRKEQGTYTSRFLGWLKADPVSVLVSQSWASGICWFIAKVHVVRFFFCQICSAGDRILLKKPQSDGVVVEYISYVTEVRGCLMVQNRFYVLHNKAEMFFDHRFNRFICSDRSVMRMWAWEWTQSFSTATSGSRWMLNSLTTGWKRDWIWF